MIILYMCVFLIFQAVHYSHRKVQIDNKVHLGFLYRFLMKYMYVH